MTITKDNWKSYLPLFIPLGACVVALIAFYYTTPLTYATKERVNNLEKQVQAQSINQIYIKDGVKEIKEQIKELLDKLDELDKEE